MTSPRRWPLPSSTRPGCPQVFDKDKIAIVLDHSTPCKDIKSAQLCAVGRDFAEALRHHPLLRRGTDGRGARPAAGEGPCAPRARSSSAPTPTPAPTARWAPSPPASAPPTWRPAWPPACAWFKVPSAIKVNLKGKLSQMGQRQGRDSPSHRHDRGGRRAVPVPGVHRGGRRVP